MTVHQIGPDPAPSARTVAREALGIDRLRPAQRAAVEALADGRDTLLVMPTGAGKSAVYQIAGSMLPGPTVVVSPLIALQRDQMESIADSRLDAAATLNSQLTERQRRDLLARVRKGHLEFVLLAPEQLMRPDTFRELVAAEPSLLVVDEAHCISEWGHDFRPDYLGLAAAFGELGRAPVLAMTATASPVTRKEIVERLRLEDPVVIVSGFDRPNLHFRVVAVPDEGRKRAILIELVDQLDPPGIVYVATRREAEDLAEDLRALRPTAAYHGGMAKREREEQQERFMSGGAEVMVATNAFGMGIDKPDVRFVIHHDVPESLDAYYQEAGRAGRDSEPAAAVLLWRAEDLGRRKALNGTGTVDPATVIRLGDALQAAGAPQTQAGLAAELDVGRVTLARLLGRLEGLGAVTLDPAAATASWATDGLSPTAAAESLAAADEQRADVEESRLAMMRAYAEARECRRRVILTYFGEEAPRWCGRCDVCDTAAPSPEDGPEGAVRGTSDPYPEQTRVVHDEFGPGLVVRCDGDRVVVLFDDAGYKTLSADLVAGAGLLRPEH